MQSNHIIHIRQLIKEQRLSEAIDATKTLINQLAGIATPLPEKNDNRSSNSSVTTPNSPLTSLNLSTVHNQLESLRDIETQLQLITDALISGLQDTQRNAFYEQLLQRMHVIIADLQMQWMCIHEKPLAYYWQPTKHFDGNADTIRQTLEKYVAEKALQQFQTTPNFQLTHFTYLSTLFKYIWLSASWKKNEEEAFTDLLLSPTVESRDVCLIISALTLSLLTVFDGRKVNTLMNVYLQTHDEHIRQRALVGWLFALSQPYDKYDSTFFQETYTQLLSDDHHVQQIVETQIQVFYCLNAEADNEEIQRDIIPTLLRNSPITLQNGQLIERDDDDPLNDILNPHADEESMEEVEHTMQRMINMQKEGADVFFGGFSKMKHFPFFNDIANWLMPFTWEHPDLQSLNSKGEKQFNAIKALLRKGPFCNSDKYSFAFVLQQTINNIPDNLLDAMVFGDLEMDESSTQHNGGAYIRRKYLQDLFRFFRLHPNKTLFHTPLSPHTPHTTPDMSLLIRQLTPHFEHSPLHFSQKNDHSLLQQRMTAVASFLYRHKHYHTLIYIINNNLVENTFQTQLLYALAMQHTGQIAESIPVLRLLVNQKSSFSPNIKALSALAKALLAEEQYAEALTLYQQLHGYKPDSIPYALRLTLCLIKEEKKQEALNTILEQSFSHPDDIYVQRMVAYTQLYCDKLQQAQQAYEKLVQHPHTQPTDVLHLAYCHWLQNDRQQAVTLLYQYASQHPTPDIQHPVLRQRLQQAFKDEQQLLQDYHIDHVEQQLVIDKTLQHAPEKEE